MSWQHQFTRTNITRETGRASLVEMTDNVIATKYICVHCTKEYWQGEEPRPSGDCPARNDKSEIRRLGVD